MVTGALLIAVDGRVVDADALACARLGKARDQLVGAGLVELLVESERPRVAGLLRDGPAPQVFESGFDGIKNTRHARSVARGPGADHLEKPR